MFRYFFILIYLGITFLGARTFDESKKILKNIYSDHQTTFYCGCDYTYQNKGNMIKRDNCGYEPRNNYTKKGNLNQRARRVEWEHVMPAENFGKHLECWKNGGRKACQNDPLFQKMESDMINLVPVIGELNGDRSNFRYGIDEPKIGQYGKCNFEVNFSLKRAYIDPKIRGDVARIYLYMSEKYNINLSKQERQMMEAWDKLDPADE